MSVTTDLEHGTTRRPWIRKALLATLASVTLIASAVTPAHAETAPQTDVNIHITGELVILQPDTATGAETDRIAYIVTDTGDQVPIEPDALPADAATGADIEATAVADSHLVADAGIRTSGTVEATSAAGQTITDEAGESPFPLAAVEVAATEVAATPAIHTVDVAVVTTSGQAAPFNDAAVDNLVSLASEFWSDQAGGSVSAINRVGTVQRYSSANACNQNNLWTEAATKFGNTTNTYYNTPGKHLLVISPNSCATGAIGLATVGSGINSGGLVWLADLPGANTQTIAHEFGHNFSLNHSNTHNCTAPTVDGVAPYTTGCTDQVYGDLYDTMAASYLLNGASNPTLTALNVTQRSRLNLLGSDLITAPTSGTTQFTLNSASGTGTRGIKVTDTNSNVTYYVEYRNATGRDANALYTRYPNPSGNERPRVGTGVRILKIDANGASVVIPKQVSAGVRSFVWGAGDTFNSAALGVSVKVDSVDGATATVSVTAGANAGGANSFAGNVLPTITGDKLTGSVLTAAPGNDWVPKPTTYKYQWMRDSALIAGATKNTYTVTTADIQKNLSVAVTATATGRTNRTWMSEQVTVPPVGPFTGTNKPAITFVGTSPIAWGTKLTAVPDAGWAPKPASYKYQWYRNGAAITGAIAAAYTVGDADMTAQLTVAVTGIRPGVTNTTWTSNPVQAGVLSTFAGIPAAGVGGKFNVGQSLLVTPSGLTPAPKAYTYQWNADGVAITGATKNLYMVKAAELGKAITVKVTAATPGYTSRTWTVGGTIAGDMLPMDGTPDAVVSGIRNVAQTLTVKPGTAGLTPMPASYTYQWLRDGVAITGATKNTYIQTNDDLNKKVTVKVTGVRVNYQNKVWTAGDQLTTGAMLPLDGTPTATVSGIRNVAQTLTVKPGTAGLTPMPASYTYQWLRDGVAITGATKNVYVQVAADLGKVITVQVTGIRATYVSKVWVVDGQGTTGATLPFSGTATTAITGITTNGQTLTAVPSGLTPAPTTFKYQWFRNGAPIVGAAAKTYVLKDAEVGKTITVTVTAINPLYVEKSWTSSATAAIAEKPSFTGSNLPTISGTTTVGQLLTATAGTGWTPVTTTFKYQWFRNGTAIAGGSAKTYKLVLADKGAKLTVTVTAVKAGYKDTVWTSAQTTTVN